MPDLASNEGAGMESWKATRVALNLRIKSLAGLRFRSLMRRCTGFDRNQFRRFQAERFNAMYRYVREMIPYYRDRPAEYPPLDATESQLFQVLSRLPILKKQTLREHNSTFWSERMPVKVKFHATSGTSGTPIRIPEALWEKGFGQAAQEDWFLRICDRRIPRMLALSGFFSAERTDTLFWRDFVFGNTHLSIYALTPANREAVIRLVRDAMPHCIYGYASAVHQLALLVGDALADIRERLIAVTTSEVLEPHWRAYLEQHLCRKVYDLYGSQEGCHAAFECSQGRRHIHPAIGIIEILDDDDQPACPGQLGRVVVTGLYRRTMPLIRYEIGDSAESIECQAACSCGLHWPAIGRIDGRTEDLVRTRDGRSIGMLSYVLMKDLPGIRKSQIAQQDFERFVVRIVRDDAEVEMSPLEQRIRDGLAERLNTDVEVRFEYLDEIPTGSRGKFKALVVEFDPHPAR